MSDRMVKFIAYWFWYCVTIVRVIVVDATRNSERDLEEAEAALEKRWEQK